MAYQGNKPAPSKINRTPAPSLDRQHGGTDYGQANDINTPASVAPGVPQPQSVLARNLQQSGDPDDTLGRVIRGDNSKRADTIPADTAAPQTRSIIADSYPITRGMTRQQNTKILDPK